MVLLQQPQETNKGPLENLHLLAKEVQEGVTPGIQAGEVNLLRWGRGVTSAGKESSVGFGGSSFSDSAKSYPSVSAQFRASI